MRSLTVSLAVLAAVAVHDSLALRELQSEEGAAQTSCEQPPVAKEQRLLLPSHELSNRAL